MTIELSPGQQQADSNHAENDHCVCVRECVWTLHQNKAENEPSAAVLLSLE